MTGKGSTPRPIPDRERYESEWDRIFGEFTSHVEVVLVNQVHTGYLISSTAGGYLDPEVLEARYASMHTMPAQAGEVEGGSTEAVGSG